MASQQIPWVWERYPILRPNTVLPSVPRSQFGRKVRMDLREKGAPRQRGQYADGGGRPRGAGMALPRVKRVSR